MNTFPNIIGPGTISGGIEDPYIEDTFETGGDAARPMFTKPREAPLPLKWNALTLAEYQTLRAFYYANRAVRFLWTNPEDGRDYLCRFVPNSIKRSASGTMPGYFAVEIKLRIVKPVALGVDYGLISGPADIIEDDGGIA